MADHTLQLIERLGTVQSPWGKKGKTAAVEIYKYEWGPEPENPEAPVTRYFPLVEGRVYRRCLGTAGWFDVLILKTTSDLFGLLIFGQEWSTLDRARTAAHELAAAHAVGPIQPLKAAGNPLALDVSLLEQALRASRVEEIALFQSFLADDISAEADALHERHTACHNQLLQLRQASPRR